MTAASAVGTLWTVIGAASNDLGADGSCLALAQGQ